ncbi:hypothetical protein VULLAG_LOCUS22861 [Vulpes lagopus]
MQSSSSSLHLPDSPWLEERSVSHSSGRHLWDSWGQQTGTRGTQIGADWDEQHLLASKRWLGSKHYLSTSHVISKSTEAPGEWKLHESAFLMVLFIAGSLVAERHSLDVCGINKLLKLLQPEL